MFYELANRLAKRIFILCDNAVSIHHQKDGGLCCCAQSKAEVRQSLLDSLWQSVQHAWLDPFPHRSRCLLYAGLALSVFLTDSPFLTYSQSQAFHWRTQRLLNYYLADESASCGIRDDCHSKTLIWVSVILSLCNNCWIFTGRFEITFKNNVLHEFFITFCLELFLVTVSSDIFVFNLHALQSVV